MLRFSSLTSRFCTKDMKVETCYSRINIQSTAQVSFDFSAVERQEALMLLNPKPLVQVFRSSASCEAA